MTQDEIWKSKYEEVVALIRADPEIFSLENRADPEIWIPILFYQPCFFAFFKRIIVILWVHTIVLEY